MSPEPAQIMWATVDELLFEKKVLGNQIDTKIVDAFETRPYLWNITYNGDYLEYFPFILYLVISLEGEGYESDSIAEVVNPSPPKKEKTITIGSKLDTYSLVDEYGDRYCFTVDPIVAKPGVVRYAVFTPKPKYILDGVDPEIQGVGSEIQGINPEIQGGDPVPEGQEEDPLEDTQKEVLEETMSEKIAYPVIYFTEKDGPLSGRHIWGIKSTDLFVAV